MHGVICLLVQGVWGEPWRIGRAWEEAAVAVAAHAAEEQGHARERAGENVEHRVQADGRSLVDDQL
eukprot:1156058-Pleurochrysis_carterae.AAC.3